MQSHAQYFVLLPGGFRCSLCPPASRRTMWKLDLSCTQSGICSHLHITLKHIWNDMSKNCIHKLKAQCSLNSVIYNTVSDITVTELEDWRGKWISCGKHADIDNFRNWSLLKWPNIDLLCEYFPDVGLCVCDAGWQALIYKLSVVSYWKLFFMSSKFTTEFFHYKWIQMQVCKSVYTYKVRAVSLTHISSCYIIDINWPLSPLRTCLRLVNCIAIKGLLYY